jgi:hypothetical protein
MTILDPRLWLAFIASLAITAGGCYFKGHADGVRATTVAAQKDQAKAVAAARAEEQRRTAAQSEIANNANQQRSPPHSGTRSASCSLNIRRTYPKRSAVRSRKRLASRRS